MTKYTIKDFSKGDKVYHLSNIKQIMIAIEINENKNEISCRWTDEKGSAKCVEYIPEELGKEDDLRPGVRLATLT